MIENSAVILTDHDIEGKWEIIQYADSGVDMTSSFASINIQFNSGGSITVSRSDTVSGGTWVIHPILGLDELSLIVTTSQKPYSILQKNWFVRNKSTSTLTLFCQHGNSTETLTLQRS